MHEVNYRRLEPGPLQTLEAHGWEGGGGGGQAAMASTLGSHIYYLESHRGKAELLNDMLSHNRCIFTSAVISEFGKKMVLLMGTIFL